MAIKYTGDDGEPMDSRKLRRSKWNKDHAQEDFDAAIESDDIGRDDGATGKKMKESQKPRREFGDYTTKCTQGGGRWWCLEDGDVELKYKLKMLEFMDSINQ